jgi:hypothetical protein
LKSRTELYVLKQINYKWPYLFTVFQKNKSTATEEYHHWDTLVPFSFFISCSFPILSQYIFLPLIYSMIILCNFVTSPIASTFLPYILLNHLSPQLCPSHCFLLPPSLTILTSLR